MYTPQEQDEARLVDILQAGTKLRDLRIGCVGQRSFNIINLILSTREKTLQNGGLFTLRTLEVMGEGLVPIKHTYEPCSCYRNLGSVTASFPGETQGLETLLDLHRDQVFHDDDTCDFIRRYGWSIKVLGAPGFFCDHHAKLLDQATQERGSIIERFNVNNMLLTAFGLDALERVVERSQNFYPCDRPWCEFGRPADVVPARRNKERLEQLI